ncbi:MAG TPA: hypothetical protein VGH28_01915 [Polyangiaceae bacterium]
MKARAKRTAKEHQNAHAAKKATYALEQHSRRSSRKSANHARSDSNLMLRAERAKRSPDARARSGK